MKALKICAQVILICLLLCLPTVTHAELQGKIYGDDVVTEDGESFNVGEFRKAINDGNIDAAETIYNDWVKRRQEMLKRGTQFGILDLYLKHCHAMILYKQGDYKACIDTEDEVLAYLRDHLNEGNENNLDWAILNFNSMLKKVDAYYALKDYADSLKVQKDTVDFIEGSQFFTQEIRLQQKKELARLYFKVHDYKSSVALYEEILKSDIEVYGENDEETLESYSNLLNAYGKLGRYEEMYSLLNRVVPIAENLPDYFFSKIVILNYQADYYLYTGQTKKSIEILERVADMSGNKKDTVNALLRNAATYMYSNDLSNALKCTLRAWDIYEKNFPADNEVRRYLLYIMGKLYIKLGNYNEGLKYSQEAMDLSGKIYGSNSEEVHDSMEVLADSYMNTNQYDKALELYKKTYDFYLEKYGNDSTKKLYSMRGIGRAYMASGDLKNGNTWLKEYTNEGVRLGSSTSFRPFFSEVRSLISSMENKSFDEINEEYIKLLESLLEQLHSDYSDSITSGLASAYSRSPRWKEAIALYEKIIESHEKQFENYGVFTTDERMKLFSQASSNYVSAAELYYKDNNFKDAFRTFERGRSRLLIDSYSEQIVKSSGFLDKKEIAKLNEYKAGLADYAKQIDEALKAGDEQARFKLENKQRNLSDEYVKYKEFLKNKYPKYKTISQANKIDIERDKNILLADTAFVDFIINDNEVTAFVFDNSGDIKAVQFELPENFFDTCNLYRKLLSYTSLETMQNANVFLYQFPDGSYKVTRGANIQRGSGAKRVQDNETFLTLKKNLSKEIGNVLFSPLAEYISKYPNLIIAPDEDLNNIPVETLEFNGKPAIETFNMSYVPSFSVLKLMHEAGEKNSKLKNRQDIYAMGNPFYGDNDADAANRSLENFLRGQRGEIAVNQFRNLKWKNLPGTKEEIDRVAEIFGNKKIFTEKSASESNLKASNQRDELAKYKYLLFSTHGLFNPNAPEYNSIVLSQGVDTKEDGYVTIGEWAGMNLNSDVVFLSACETGLGEYQVGEGIIGLPYALTIAGNKNTVMSLWEVQDKYAPEFVSTFFKKMKEGKSAFIAINETKREFLKHKDEMYRDPSVWSAFVLYGF